MSIPPRVEGVVLCGGASTRMGRDKALLQLDGETMAERAVRRLRAVADPVMLACGTRRLHIAGCETVTDAMPRTGPLGAIVAALRRASRPLLAVVAADMPWIDAELLSAMARAWQGADAMVPCSDRGDEPLHALYAQTALPPLERALGESRLRLRSVLHDLDVVRVPAEQLIGADRARHFATNVNTPEEWRDLSPAPADV